MYNLLTNNLFCSLIQKKNIEPFSKTTSDGSDQEEIVILSDYENKNVSLIYCLNDIFCFNIYFS